MKAFFQLCVLVFITQVAFAQPGPPDENVTPDEKKLLPVREVETGLGGNIKLERKYRTRVESLYEWHAHLLWESRYVTEGRDNLSGKGLLSASTEFSIDEFSVVPWIAAGDNAGYTEFNLNVVNGSRLTEKLVLYLGYNYIYAKAPEGEFNDNEISLDLVYKWLEHVNLLTSVYHSFDAGGSFMEAAVKYSDKINKKVYYSMQGVLGINADYIPDGHNGVNHFQLRTSASYHPGRQIEVYAYAAYNIAINQDAMTYAGDELLRDFFWGGIGFTYLF